MELCFEFEIKTRSNCCEIKTCRTKLQFFAETLLQLSRTT